MWSDRLDFHAEYVSGRIEIDGRKCLPRARARTNDWTAVEIRRRLGRRHGYKEELCKELLQCAQNGANAFALKSYKYLRFPVEGQTFNPSACRIDDDRMLVVVRNLWYGDGAVDVGSQACHGNETNRFWWNGWRRSHHTSQTRLFVLSREPEDMKAVEISYNDCLQQRVDPWALPSVFRFVDRWELGLFDDDWRILPLASVSEEEPTYILHGSVLNCLFECKLHRREGEYELELYRNITMQIPYIRHEWEGKNQSIISARRGESRCPFQLGIIEIERIDEVRIGGYNVVDLQSVVVESPDYMITIDSRMSGMMSVVGGLVWQEIPTRFENWAFAGKESKLFFDIGRQLRNMRYENIHIRFVDQPVVEMEAEVAPEIRYLHCSCSFMGEAFEFHGTVTVRNRTTAPSWLRPFEAPVPAEDWHYVTHGDVILRPVRRTNDGFDDWAALLNKNARRWSVSRRGLASVTFVADEILHCQRNQELRARTVVMVGTRAFYPNMTVVTSPNGERAKQLALMDAIGDPACVFGLRVRNRPISFKNNLQLMDVQYVNWYEKEGVSVYSMRVPSCTIVFEPDGLHVVGPAVLNTMDRIERVQPQLIATNTYDLCHIKTHESLALMGRGAGIGTNMPAHSFSTPLIDIGECYLGVGHSKLSVYAIGTKWVQTNDAEHEVGANEELRRMLSETTITMEENGYAIYPEFPLAVPENTRVKLVVKQQSVVFAPSRKHAYDIGSRASRFIQKVRQFKEGGGYFEHYVAPRCTGCIYMLYFYKIWKDGGRVTANSTMTISHSMLPYSPHDTQNAQRFSLCFPVGLVDDSDEFLVFAGEGDMYAVEMRFDKAFVHRITTHDVKTLRAEDMRYKLIRSAN